MRVDALEEAPWPRGLPGPTIVCSPGGQRAQRRSTRSRDGRSRSSYGNGAWAHVARCLRTVAAAASVAVLPPTVGHPAVPTGLIYADKTLNVPYDNGLAIVADSAAMYADGL